MKNTSKTRALACIPALLGSVLGVVAIACAPLYAQDPDVNVLTWGYDQYKTEQNLNEATLTKTALQSTSNKFGQLCDISLDGQVYAQPLVVADVKFNGATTPYTSVVYVVTQNDTVYAINGTPLRERARSLVAPRPRARFLVLRHCRPTTSTEQIQRFTKWTAPSSAPKTDNA